MNVYKIYYDNDQDFNKKMKLKLIAYGQNDQLVEKVKNYESPQSYMELGDLADNNAIKHITKTSNKVFMSLDNHNYIIVMNYDRAIKDRVFRPIKEEIEMQLEKQKSKEERKITRSNKITSYLKGKGIALPLSLMIGISTLGFAIVSGHSKDNDTDQTLSVTPIVEGSPENQELPPTSMVTITPNNEVSVTPNLTPDIINTSTPDDSLVTDNIPSFYYDYEDRSNSVDLYRTKELYGDIIEKTANTYGLDPNLVLAIATQERGIHSSQKDPGGATGLMQIQGGAWIGEKLTVHNFISGQDETIIIQED